MPDLPDPNSVPRAAQRQGGVFTRTQAAEEGWTPRQIRRRQSAGRWRTVAGSALAADSGTPWTSFQFAMAAHLTWPGGVISHSTAALLHGFPVEAADGADVIVPAGHRSRRLLRAHACSLAPHEITRHSGVPITTRRRTAEDCLATFPFDDALDLWAWVTTRSVVTRADLLSSVHSRVGCPGTLQLRQILELTAGGAVNRAEHRLHRILQESGITGWAANVDVAVNGRTVAVADVLFEREKVIVEIDGYRAHSSRRAFAGDRRRQNLLVGAGYIVLRYTWDDIAHRAGLVVEQIRRALATAEDRIEKAGLTH